MWTDTPILDNHLHLDIEHGRGLNAVEEFARCGGTHLLVVNKPSWQLGTEVSSGDDFRPGFEVTIDTVSRSSELLDGRAWSVLGVHPALISRLVDDRGFEVPVARDLMCDGIDVAAEYVADGRALALKSGRPHYDVSEVVWNASNDVLRHTLSRASENDCAVQLHTEQSGNLTQITDWATEIGLDPHRLVKHYAEGPLDGPIPSVISNREHLDNVVERTRPFLMETDFLDEPDRPGAVLGPKTVPRRVAWLADRGDMNAIQTAHIETPRLVYGIDTVATLVR